MKQRIPFPGGLRYGRWVINSELCKDLNAVLARLDKKFASGKARLPAGYVRVNKKTFNYYAWMLYSEAL